MKKNINSASIDYIKFFQRHNVITIFSIMLMLVGALSTTYAILTVSTSKTTESTQGGCFVVNYSGQNINNMNLAASETYNEGESSNIILSKNSGCDIYNNASIYIHTNNTETTAPIEDGALKYKILNGTTDVATGSITVKNGNQLLATVPLTTTETTYKVYLWIDYNISHGAYNEKTYSGYLYAESTQTSTIK